MELVSQQKKPWPTLPLTIGAYTVKDFKEVESEVECLKGFHFLNLSFQFYDPKRIVPAHCKRDKFNWTYQDTESVV